MNAIDARHAMIEAARAFYAFGWMLGTSGNLSCRLSADRFLITGSGHHKGALSDDDFLVCDLTGAAVDQTPNRPSAETLLHCKLYEKFSDVGAIFHVHEPFSALCSRRDAERGATRFEDHEMLKGLGIWESDAVVDVPIVENESNIPELAKLVGEAARIDVPAVMVSSHGYYTWGKDPDEARRRVESLAYLYHFSWRLESSQ